MGLKTEILNKNLTKDQVGIFYLGQVGFLLKYREKYILIDGYLSDYVDRNCCSELVQWVRRYPAPLTGEDLDFVDYVFCTHAHYDHADPDTLSAIAHVNKKATFIVPQAIVSVIGGYNIATNRIQGVRTDKKYVSDDEPFTFMAVPSAHEELHPDGNEGYEEVGYRFTFGNVTLYHSGDCCMYDGLTERIMDTDILMLPINGRDYYRNRGDIIGCFDSVEALTLAKEAHCKMLIPTHFDLYDVNAVNPAYFVDCQQRINPVQRYHIFMPGEGFIYG